MIKSTLKVALSAIIFSLMSFGAFAKSEQHNVNPLYEVVRVSGHALGMSQDELERAFHVIRQFQAGRLTLPKLDALSDRQVLGKIDFYAEPYAQITKESMMITWKRYELETEMLAEKADLDLAKFAPFYRSFNLTIGIGKKIHDYQLSLRNADSTDSYSKWSSGSAGPDVPCDASCQAIADQDFDSYKDILAFLHDMRAWENKNGSLPHDSTVRIINSESSGSVKLKKHLGSVAWHVGVDRD